MTVCAKCNHSPCRCFRHHVLTDAEFDRQWDALDSPRVEAPWTDEQVENLRRRQAAQWLHPYTGPDHVDLVPSREGWRLPDGTIFQTWAHQYDVDGDIGTDPLASLRSSRKAQGESDG